MMAVLKNVGKGILYILGLPFFILILVLTGIAGIFVLIFMFFKSIILFFTGRSLDDELPEDRKARQIKEGNNPTPAAPREENIVNTYIPPQPAEPQQSSIEEAVFGQTVNPEPEQEPIPEYIPEPQEEEERSSDEIFDSIFGNTTTPEEPEYRTVDIETPEEEDPIGEYIPHKSRQRIVEDNSEDEDNSATNIYFGGDDD